MNKVLALLIAAFFAAGAIAAGDSASSKSMAANDAKMRERQANSASTAASAQNMKKSGEARRDEPMSTRVKRRLSSAAQ